MELRSFNVTQQTSDEPSDSVHPESLLIARYAR